MLLVTLLAELVFGYGMEERRDERPEIDWVPDVGVLSERLRRVRADNSLVFIQDWVGSWVRAVGRVHQVLPDGVVVFRETDGEAPDLWCAPTSSVKAPRFWRGSGLCFTGRSSLRAGSWLDARLSSPAGVQVSACRSGAVGGFTPTASRTRSDHAYDQVSAIVNGSSPGPAPAAQARASAARLTRSSWRTWPHRELLRKVPSVDGAFTTQPMATPVPLVRRASALSMQSPPARAEATNVSSLFPAFARPGASPKSTWLSTSSPSPQMARQGDRQDQSSVGRQVVIVEGDVDAVEVVAW